MYSVCTRTWVWPLASDDLNKEHTTGKDVQFAGVCRGICQCLGRHVAIGSGAVGGSEARVTAQQLGHAKVGHLGSPAADQEDIVAAEVSVQHLVVMEVGESLCHIVTNVHLHVERERGRVRRPLQEAGHTLVHQLHEQDGHSSLGVRTRAQVLDDVGMPQTAQEVDLTLEALHDAVGGGVPGLEEDGVQDFGGANELVTFSPVYGTVGAVPQRILLRLDQYNIAEPEATLDTYLGRHWIDGLKPSNGIGGYMASAVITLYPAGYYIIPQ